jgi:hypothetical protein
MVHGDWCMVYGVWCSLVLMLPFEMRTVLSRIHLIIDTHHRTAFYITWKQRGREQDSGVTHRENVCEAAWGES